MYKKKIITIISIVVTVLIIATVAVLIIHKNNSTVKAVISEYNMKDKEIEDTSSEEPTEEITEEPTVEQSGEPEEKITPKPTTLTTSNSKYYIKVNNQMNTVTIYTKDVNGKYTVPIKAMVCSTGNATPKNSKYQIKGRWNWGLMFGGVYTQYETHIVGDFLFHSVPYLRRYDHNSLEYWLYDKLGTTCSAGCVRLTVADAKWIYDNIPTGTWVEFYSSSNPGPLGKPTAMKISGNVECRGWDPTDPDPRNPWKNVNTSNPEPTQEPTLEPIPETPLVPSVEPKTPTPVIPSTEPTTTASSVTTNTPTPSPSASPNIQEKPTPSTEKVEQTELEENNN